MSLKYRMIEQIIQSRDDIVLNKVKKLLDLEQQEGDFWEILPDGIRLAIEAAEKEIDEGKGIKHEKVMQEIKARIKP